MNKRAIFELLNQLLGKIHLRHIITALRSLKILEVDMGHSLSSRLWESVNSKKEPVPWFTYPAIHFIDNLDLKNKHIFEYGSGYSTLYWAARANHVESVEDNHLWYKKIYEVSRKYKNLSLSYIDDARFYVPSINRSRKLYDVIVIDGKNRFDCAKKAANKIKKGGLIIVDNSDRHPEISKFLIKKKFTKIDFRGFGPINHYVWTTSVFFSKNINFKQLIPIAEYTY